MPTTNDGRTVYLYQPSQPPECDVARLAASILNNSGPPKQEGLVILYPKARTGSLPAHEWVLRLRSEDALWYVRQYVNGGEAIIDENGFFARDTQIIEMGYLCIPPKRYRVSIDGPFMVFFAENGGVQAAAWFDRDSFKFVADRRVED